MVKYAVAVQLASSQAISYDESGQNLCCGYQQTPFLGLRKDTGEHPIGFCQDY